ncbi:MAG: LamG domain-containing protein [Chitinispirillaceae bacterium]|nr:LamG domain-containing protein [Chitinispirillaceae bacterium]
MIHQINPSPLLKGVICSISAGILFLAGCNGNNITDTSDQKKSESGAVNVSVHLGKIGTLSKRSVIEMDYLVIQIRNTETDSIVVSDTSELSGNEEAIIDKSFPDLSAPDSFMLSVISIDMNEETIHRGSTGFATTPDDTVDVSLDLDALYSMLRASFNDIPDSIDEVTLMIDGLDTLDSSFTTGTRERIVFEYDYLDADAEGIEYDLSLRASGSFCGNDTVLYAADTTIVAISGVDTNFRIVLTWVGPDIPHGAAEFTVTIGSIGTTSINTEFESIPGVIPVNGLTAYFPFNGNADDASGNGIDGTVHGANLTSDRFGRSNAAYSFNGTSDYIDLGTENPVTGNHFSLSMWIHFTDTVATYIANEWYGSTVLMKGNQAGISGSYGVNISNYVQGEPITFKNAAAWVHVNPNNETTSYSAGSSKGIFSAHQWYHVVCTLNNNVLKMFIDGELASSSSVNGQIVSSDLPLAIGRKGTTLNADHFFKGSIDDIRIYDKAISENQVVTLYHENGWTGN